ncbi:hypothetical protein EOM39_00010 [Candidatus Gracilibacteria bacterium]|nr:hypothetical protein [Candidatus Gracilibacteria bacterium]
MKENIMRDKIVSFVLGLLIGGAIVYGYTYFMGDNTQQGPTGGPMGNFDSSNMSDEQLERMATRAGITKDELKKRLEAGESLRDIMPARTGSGANMGGRREAGTTTGTN